MKGGGPPRWQSGKESHSEEDLAWIPGLGRSPAGGQGNPLQCSCLENSVERGAWQIQSTGLQRVGHNWVTNTFTFTFRHRFLLSVCWARRDKLVLDKQGFPCGASGKEPASQCRRCKETCVGALGQEPSRRKCNPLQYSCLRISWTEELGGLQFIGLQRVGQTEAT